MIPESQQDLTDNPENPAAPTTKAEPGQEQKDGERK